MCKALEDIKRHEMEKGVKIGRKQGRKQGTAWGSWPSGSPPPACGAYGAAATCPASCPSGFWARLTFRERDYLGEARAWGVRFLLGIENQQTVNLTYPWRLMEMDCPALSIILW